MPCSTRCVAQGAYVSGRPNPPPPRAVIRLRGSGPPRDRDSTSTYGKGGRGRGRGVIVNPMAGLPGYTPSRRGRGSVTPPRQWSPSELPPSVPPSFDASWIRSLPTVPSSGIVNSEIWMGHKLIEARVESPHRDRKPHDCYVLVPVGAMASPHRLLVCVGDCHPPWASFGAAWYCQGQWLYTVGMGAAIADVTDVASANHAFSSLFRQPPSGRVRTHQVYPLALVDAGGRVLVTRATAVVAELALPTVPRRIVAKAVLSWKGSFLWGRRWDDRKYDTLGGQADGDELPSQALVRELSKDEELPMAPPSFHAWLAEVVDTQPHGVWQDVFLTPRGTIHQVYVWHLDVSSLTNPTEWDPAPQEWVPGSASMIPRERPRQLMTDLRRTGRVGECAKASYLAIIDSALDYPPLVCPPMDGPELSAQSLQDPFSPLAAPALPVTSSFSSLAPGPLPLADPFASFLPPISTRDAFPSPPALPSLADPFSPLYLSSLDTSSSPLPPDDSGRMTTLNSSLDEPEPASMPSPPNASPSTPIVPMHETQTTPPPSLSCKETYETEDSDLTGIARRCFSALRASSRAERYLVPLTNIEGQWHVFVSQEGNALRTTSHSRVGIRQLLLPSKPVDALFYPKPTRDKGKFEVLGSLRTSLLPTSPRAPPSSRTSISTFFIPYVRASAIRRSTSGSEGLWVSVQALVESLPARMIQPMGRVLRDLTMNLHLSPVNFLPPVLPAVVTPRPLHLLCPPCDEISTWHASFDAPTLTLPPGDAHQKVATVLYDSIFHQLGESPSTQEIIRDAHSRARQSGASRVTLRDLRDAAISAVGGRGRTIPTMEPLPPAHLSRILCQRAQSTSRISAGISDGTLPRAPRVLLFGDVTSVAATEFVEHGWTAVTCDLKPTEQPHPLITHVEGDGIELLDLDWDLVVGFPPCRYLSNAGVQYLHTEPERWQLMAEAAEVFRRVNNAAAPFVATENSRMHRYARQRLGGLRPTQITHPHQHGHGETKPTGLYLKGLPPLRPSCQVEGRRHRLANLSPSPERAAERARFFPGVAAAMAHQWTPVVLAYLASKEVVDTMTASEVFYNRLLSPTLGGQSNYDRTIYLH